MDQDVEMEEINDQIDDKKKEGYYLPEFIRPLSITNEIAVLITRTPFAA